MKALINGNIILKDKILEQHVIIFNKKILDILTFNDYKQKYKNIEEIDVHGKYISAGFIDIHIHGANNSDVMDGTRESLENIAKTIAKNGVTGFLATTMTMSREDILKALKNIKNNIDIDSGAKILGTHLEGPFINEKYKGAQSSDYILNPEYKLIENYTDIIKIITYAPEKDKNFEFTHKMCNCHKDITLSIGHSNATYNIAMEAIQKGARHITHLFNAMTGLHHRNPGIVGAAFNSDVSCEIIADNIHINPANYHIVFKQKSKDKIVLITDSMRAACLKSGKYDLGGQDVYVDEKAARLEDGTLAGSILRLNNAVKNIHDEIDISLVDLINLVTLNPAKIIGVDNIKGSIKKDKYSDFAIFDKEFNVDMTIVEGKIVYNKGKK
ncbi:N-acetylglucosamine-6-phosphate deacetylase [Hypnocyclicus thermotrophus]|uniref:N-acetylglucosamine-6-phosphate deacetylase n=1 Tax=Hypnocyclicus thermotrophus TaxID=1627895 RepID=A0AA46DYP9_9FUSO|nr:N-acetylglucosamine-6-phosphate deacetylase [Hypnocyclicus thermotrophus]TDT70556.1 N-acetylglucosamine-6-phosphate deacetylase [Hypnocyclicus thermotrophus]